MKSTQRFNGYAKHVWFNSLMLDYSIYRLGSSNMCFLLLQPCFTRYFKTCVAGGCSGDCKARRYPQLRQHGEAFKRQVPATEIDLRHLLQGKLKELQHHHAVLIEWQHIEIFVFTPGWRNDGPLAGQLADCTLILMILVETQL